MNKENSSILQKIDPTYKKIVSEGISLGYLPNTEKLLSLNLATLKQEIETAKHEIGHKIVGVKKGFQIGYLSIIRKGSVLGETKIITNGHSTKDTMLGMLSVFFGGKCSESFTGKHNHVGCGSDLYRAKLLSFQLVNYLGLQHTSPNSLLSDAENFATSSISNYGESNINKEAWELQRKKFIG